MKNQKLGLISLGAVASTALFYNQGGIGINLMLFALVVPLLQILSRKGIIYNKTWVLFAVGTFLTSIGYNLTNLYLTFILFMASMSVSIYLHSVKAEFLPFAPLHFIINFFGHTRGWIRNQLGIKEKWEEINPIEIPVNENELKLSTEENPLDFETADSYSADKNLPDQISEIESIDGNTWKKNDSPENEEGISPEHQNQAATNWTENEVEKAKPTSNLIYKIRKILVPALLFTVFIFMYTLANQGFENLVLSFTQLLSISFFLLLAGFFVWMITALDGKGYPFLASWEANLKESWSLSSILKESEIVPLVNKQKEAFISLIGLIVILAVLLGFEFASVFSPSKDSNLAEDLHGNIFAVIFSIVLAAFVTIYYFSGNVFFMAKIKIVEKLIYTWLGLNGILAAIGMYKTFQYIAHYGLTYKRLSVIEYLTTILTGLIIIAWCIHYKKGNFKLVNLVVSFSYGYLILFTLPNWDRIMVWHNFTKVDRHDLLYYKKLSISGFTEYLNLKKPNKNYLDNSLEVKIRRFENKFPKYGPLGKSLEDIRVMKELKAKFDSRESMRKELIKSTCYSCEN